MLAFNMLRCEFVNLQNCEFVNVKWCLGHNSLFYYAMRGCLMLPCTFVTLSVTQTHAYGKHLETRFLNCLAFHTQTTVSNVIIRNANVSLSSGCPMQDSTVWDDKEGGRRSEVGSRRPVACRRLARAKLMLRGCGSRVGVWQAEDRIRISWLMQHIK